VGVDIKRDADVGVAQALGHHFGMDACPQGQSRVSVPDIVQADAGLSRVLDRSLERLADEVGVIG